MLEIRERCAWDMKELCTDKTLGTSKTLEDIFKLNYQQQQKSKINWRENMHLFFRKELMKNIPFYR